MPVRTDEQLKKHQAALLELLTVFDNICRRLGISYQLFAGTALGAVRHKGFMLLRGVTFSAISLCPKGFLSMSAAHSRGHFLRLFRKTAHCFAEHERHTV